MSKSENRGLRVGTSGGDASFLGKKGMHSMMMVLSATLLAVNLTGCFPLAAAGVAVGTLAATDRRTLGAQADDKAIELKAGSRINERYGDRVRVDVVSYNRRVLILGQVPDAGTKSGVEQTVAGVENVLSVVNELEFIPPSAFSTRASDVLITANVKAALVDAQGLFVNSFKVVTERGTVYLMGRVTQREGDLAGDVVRSLRGVQRVVKVLEYISEEELTRLRIQPAAAPESGTRP